MSINGKKSSLTDKIHGIPQERIIGPILLEFSEQLTKLDAYGTLNFRNTTTASA